MPRMSELLRSAIVAGACLLLANGPIAAQQMQDLQKSLTVERRQCPGDPPGNLASLDCRFSSAQRFDQFVSTSLTDQAMLGATFYGTMAQIFKNPPEWDRDWTGYGYRVGSRYAQNLAKGLTNYAFGSLLRSDPRHISYASDPRIAEGSRKTGVRPRIAHAFMDFLTVRRSSPDGAGRPLPNIPLFAGAAASGFVGNTWYPDRLATPEHAAMRAVSSLGTALAGSFYTEFQPEIGRLLGSIFQKRSSKPSRAGDGK